MIGLCDYENVDMTVTKGQKAARMGGQADSKKDMARTLFNLAHLQWSASGEPFLVKLRPKLPGHQQQSFLESVTTRVSHAADDGRPCLLHWLVDFEGCRARVFCMHRLSCGLHRILLLFGCSGVISSCLSMAKQQESFSFMISLHWLYLVTCPSVPHLSQP